MIRALLMLVALALAIAFGAGLGAALAAHVDAAEDRTSRDWVVPAVRAAREQEREAARPPVARGDREIALSVATGSVVAGLIVGLAIALAGSPASGRGRSKQ